MDILTQIMQQADIARYRQLITEAEYKEIRFILQTARSRQNRMKDSQRESVK